MLSKHQQQFIDYVKELAPAVAIASQNLSQSDDHLIESQMLFADHLHEALKLITPLAADDQREVLRHEQ